MVAKHCGNGKRLAARFACRRKGLDQANQLHPRQNNFHFVKILTLSRVICYQFKSGAREGGLLHQDITLDLGVGNLL
jgi:hypothetical protein